MLETEKAQVMFKLARKNNWNACYDRTEHFKRFQALDEIIKELSKCGWLIMHKKPKFLGISLNTQFKKEIIEFIEQYMPELRGYIK
jgi:GTP-sensing pleiotropic transcriptional regulator CodY